IAEDRDSESRMTPAQMADFYRGYRETIDRVIDDRLGGVLEELGFVRRKRHLFVLETPVMRKCVAFTSSNRYLGDFEEITGVYVPGLEALVDELCPRDLLPDGVKLGRALGPFAYHAATTAIRT